MNNNAKIKQSEKMIEPIINDVGEFFWPIEDVCRLLEISDVDQAIAELEPYEKAEMVGNPESNAKVPAVVAEEGLFSLLLKGNAPIAKEFRRWVTRDLLLRVLLDEEPLHKSDRPIKEKLLTSGFLPMPKSSSKKDINITVEPIECGCCGDLFWPADDVCKLLEINDANRVLQNLEPDEKTEIVFNKIKNGSVSIEAETDVLTLAGVFTLIFQSKASVAIALKRIIAHEVLPGTMTGKKQFQNIDFSLRRTLGEIGLLSC